MDKALQMVARYLQRSPQDTEVSARRIKKILPVIENALSSVTRDSNG